MKIRWRTVLLSLHRDLGYFFTGSVLIFAISGIALNHKDDWNPNFIISRRAVVLDLPQVQAEINRDAVLNALDEVDITDPYRAHDFPSPGKMKVFTKRGSLMVNTTNGLAEYESFGRRPFFYQVNVLHLNPNRWWTVYSDLFSASLVLIAITGLFLARGRYGLKWRGATLVSLGVAVPVAFLLVIR